MDYETAINQNKLNTAVEEQEFNLLRVLNPKLEKDGNMWLCTYGEDIATGIVGTGPTPYLAVIAFNKAFHDDKGVYHLAKP